MREKIDAALYAYARRSHSEERSDCAANNEDLYCCLERGHDNYQQLLDFLTERLK